MSGKEVLFSHYLKKGDDKNPSDYRGMNLLNTLCDYEAPGMILLCNSRGAM
jgi:hypothetical protein